MDKIDKQDIDEKIFPEKYTDDNGKRHKINSYEEYISLVESEIIHANTLVHNGKHWNYHARYANPNSENPLEKDKFADMWKKMR